jgi:hypothetical protein
MATSGTAVFNLDLSEVVEEAFERCGSELRTGYDLRTARRSLNLLFADWANRGINMWTMEQGTITLVYNQMTYALPNDTVDLLEHQIRTQANSSSNQADLNITRISISTYATIPNKLTTSRPIQILVQRNNGMDSPIGATLPSTITASATTITLSSTAGLPAQGFIKIDNEVIVYGYITGNTLYNCFRGQQGTTAAIHTSGTTVYWAQVPCVTVWPVPDNSTTYTLVYWRLRRTQDAGQGVDVADVPFRFIPCMVAGLSYYMGMKIPEAYDRLPVLKAQYEEAWQLASDEDREKAAIRFVPRQQFIGGATT